MQGWGDSGAMDRVDGDEELPVTWHRYIYGADNPANNTDPRGLMFVPSNPLWGTLIHQEIGADFVGKNEPCGESNIALSSILGIPSLRRPDLVNTCTHEVYEIKPFSSLWAGWVQLTGYLALMRAADPASGWTYGSSYEPPPTVSIVPYVTFAVVFPPLNGVIPYQVIDLSSVVAAIAFAGAFSNTVEEVGSVSALATTAAGFL